MLKLCTTKKQHRDLKSGTHRLRINLFTALAGAMLLLLSAGVDGSGDACASEVLKGIRHIGVEVEDLPRMAVKLGITKDSLKTDVTAMVRQSGIDVVSDDDLKQNPSIPFLKVSLIMGYSKPAYLYAVLVGLNEKVSLERDPRIISYAMPWWRIVKGEHAGETDIPGFVHETLRYIVNEFIANYNAANTETTSPEEKNNQQPTGDLLKDKHDGQNHPPVAK